MCRAALAEARALKGSALGVDEVAAQAQPGRRRPASRRATAPSDEGATREAAQRAGPSPYRGLRAMSVMPLPLHVRCHFWCHVHHPSQDCIRFGQLRAAVITSVGCMAMNDSQLMMKGVQALASAFETRTPHALHQVTQPAHGAPSAVPSAGCHTHRGDNPGPGSCSCCRGSQGGTSSIWCTAPGAGRRCHRGTSLRSCS